MDSVSSPDEGASLIRIGADLITSSQHHVEFLKTVNNNPTLYSGKILQQAIWRYVKFWLPLAAEHPEEILAAPLDIEWVWHCHMLSPILYGTDVMNICGKFIRHKLTDKHNYQQAVAFSEKYWKVKYPEEAFIVDLHGSGTAENEDALVSQIGDLSRSLGLQYDLEAAAERQKVFFYQVSLPHYQDEKFLLTALKRYKKFLYLKKTHPHTFLVPCYDIDLIWHTHMNFPLIYKDDTEYVLGKLLSHDDSVNDRSVGSKLDRSYADTRGLWKLRYNETYSNFGAMYRGHPPNGKLYQVPNCDIFGLFSKDTRIMFERIHLNEKEKASKKFRLHITEKDNIVIGNKGSKSNIVDCSDHLLTLKGPPCGWEKAGSIQKRLNCIGSNNIYIQIKPCKSLFHFGDSKKSTREAKIDLEKISCALTCVKKSVSERVQLDLDNKVQVTLDLTLTPERLGDCTLWLVPGQFQDCVMPEESEQMWGPVTLPRLPPGVENKCSAASHK